MFLVCGTQNGTSTRTQPGTTRWHKSRHREQFLFVTEGHPRDVLETTWRRDVALFRRFHLKHKTKRRHE